MPPELDPPLVGAAAPPPPAGVLGVAALAPPELGAAVPELEAVPEEADGVAAPVLVAALELALLVTPVVPVAPVAPVLPVPAPPAEGLEVGTVMGGAWALSVEAPLPPHAASPSTRRPAASNARVRGRKSTPVNLP